MRLLVAFLVGVATALTASIGPTLASAAELDDEVIADLEQALDAGFAASGLPGVAVGLWIPDVGEWVATRGLADVTTKQPMTADLQAPVGSITKSLAVTIALELVDEGVLDLDEPIDRWYPDFPEASAITIRMLMDHSSGIASTSLKQIESLCRAPHRLVSPEELIAIAATLPRAEFSPGKGYLYSSANTIILGRIMEKVTGASFSELLDERLIGPLGLQRTKLATDGRLDPPFSHGYTGFCPNLPSPVDTSTWVQLAFSAGALASTLDDLHKWGTALGEGYGLAPETHALRVEQELGVATERDMDRDNVVSLGHAGSEPGYAATVVYYPCTGAVWALMTNGDGGTGEAFVTVLAALHPIVRQIAAPPERCAGAEAKAEAVAIDEAMTTTRLRNQNVNYSDAAQLAQAMPPSKPLPELPYVLVGVRDASGFRGFANPEAGAPSPETPFPIASSTKTFTAALILQLDQEGILSIDDTLDDPRWRDVIRWPNGEKITLRMLLAHTSGIPNYAEAEDFVERDFDPDWLPTPQEMIAFARVLPALFPPDGGWAYSNTGYQILGLVIEAATGMSYTDVLRQRLLEPLGLTHTYLSGKEAGAHPAPGYFLWCQGIPLPAPSASAAVKQAAEAACEGKNPTYRTVTEYYANNERAASWSDGGLISTAEDMTLWITKLIASDAVLDEAHREMMQQATPQSVKAITGNANYPPSARRTWTGYGLGLQIYEYEVGRGFGHGGNIKGASTNSVYLPGEGNDFALQTVAPLFEADSAFNSSDRIASALVQSRWISSPPSRHDEGR